MEAVIKDQVTDDASTMSRDAENLAPSSTNDSDQRLADARARASLRNAYASLSKTGGELTTQARAAARATDQYVRDKPWHTLGVAAGVGFLLGYLLGRR